MDYSEAVKFIRDYESGLYGGAIQGDTKALMYHQALLLDNKRDLRNLLFWANEVFVGSFNDKKCSPEAWVMKDGVVLYCGFGQHDRIATDFMLTKDFALFEKENARVTKVSKSAEEVLDRVDKPTRIQRRAVENIMEKTGRY